MTKVRNNFKVINRFAQLSFKDFNELYLLLQFGSINEAADILKITHNALKYTLTVLGKYDQLLLLAYNNHKNNNTRMLLRKQSQKDIDKVKRSYNNILEINNKLNINKG